MLVEYLLSEVEDLGIAELQDFCDKWTDFLESEFEATGSWPFRWSADFDPQVVNTVDLPD